MAKTNRNPYKTSFFKQIPVVTSAAISLLALLLFTFFIGLPWIIKEQITMKARLINGTDTWSMWQVPTHNMFIKFYIYNVTNGEEVMHNKSKFHLQEVGPYVWQEKRIRNVLEENLEEDTVRYTETTHFFFREDLSVGSDEDMINVVSIPFVALSTILYQKVYSFLANSLIDEFVESEKENVVQRVKVKEFIFDGVKLNPMYETLANLGGITLPVEFHEGTFAMYNQRNGSTGPEYKINRGVKDTKKFGEIEGFDGKPETDWWKNEGLPSSYGKPHCNQIKGSSDGGLFPPFVTKDQTVYVFSHEICRNIYLRFIKDVDVNGIPAYHFRIPDEMLAHPNEIPENECYQTSYGHGLTDPVLKGAYRMFTCKGGVPLVLSKPHYLGASDEIRESVVGLGPDCSIHDVELEIEPNTGALLRINRRIQINLEYMPLPEITAFEGVNHSAIPVFWVDEAFTIDDEFHSYLYNMLVIPLKVVGIGKWVILALTAVTIVILILQLTRRKNNNDKEPLPLSTSSIIETDKVHDNLLQNSDKS